MAEQVPETVYYPLARVRLAVRFDEFSDKDTPEPPAKPPQIRKGKGDPVLELKRITNAEGAEAILLEAKGQGSQIGPSSSQPASDDGRTFTIDGITPKNASLCRNGIRVADTLKLTIAVAEFPFDPRLIRACGVEFYLGVVDPQVFAEQAAGQFGTHLLEDFSTDHLGRLRRNLRFQGWVDDWNFDLPEEEEGMVQLDCTDQTRLLLDENAPPKLAVAADAPIDEAIAEYMANWPQFKGFAVQYRPNQEDRPTLKDVLAKSAFKPELGPAPNGGGKLKVWDYFTDVAGSCGHIVFVDTLTLDDGSHVPVVVIQRPRTLYGARFQKNQADPFAGRILPSGRVLTNRTFTYGANLLNMSMQRKFSRFEPKSVEVRSYSPKAKKTLVVRHPAEKKDRPKKLAPGNQADQKWEVVTVDGVEDEETLRVIAQGVYEQLQRQELTVKAHTKNLASLGGKNIDPDILDVTAGATIEVEVDRDSLAANTVVSAEGFAAQNAAGFLKQLGYSDELAAAYAKAASALGFPTQFRVKTATFDWDEEEGVGVDLELMNYIEVKMDWDLPGDEEQQPDDFQGSEPEKVVVE